MADPQKNSFSIPKNEAKISNNLTQAGRIPPQALDMEQAVLGALLLEKNALHRITDVLRSEMFYKESHKLIFEAILLLFQESQPIDVLTVKDSLRKSGNLEAAGGAFYLADLTSRVASAANIEYHGRVIAEKYILRELIRISDNVIKDAFDETSDVFELLDKTEQSLFEVSETHLRRNYMGMPELVMKTLARLEELKGKDEAITGVSSGFQELDKITSGWQSSDLVIIAARPAMGKCLGKGTKVLMYDGTLKKVENIIVGDVLMGDDSTPRNVLSLARGKENMYWVRQKRGIDYRVNESHILSLVKKGLRDKSEKGEVLNIPLTEYLLSSRTFKKNLVGYRVPIEFPEQALSFPPYLLGLWLCQKQDEAIIKTREPEIIDYLEDYAAYLKVNLVQTCTESKLTTCTLEKQNPDGSTENILLRELQKLGVWDNKHIPKAYFANSSENRMELLAGLLDAKGIYSMAAKAYDLYIVDLDLAKEIKLLGDSLGFRVNIRLQSKNPKDGHFHHNIVSILGDLHTIPLGVIRKQAIVQPRIVDHKYTEIMVEFDKEDNYYGFEIDGNHLFLLEDMTVTHNTAFVLTVARNAAARNAPVAFFSLEMAAVQLVQRLVCAEAELDAQKVRTGKLENYEWQQLISRIGNLSNAPIFIDDTPGISIMDLRAKCRRLKAEKNIQIVVIDYLQLMTGNASKGGNREQEIAGISRALKELAKELGVCVIALAQLSRAVESRGGDKRPMLSDLRESGSIEQDADMVMALYRPEYYGFETDEEGNSTQGLAEVIILKQRNGPTGTVKLQFIGKFGKFADLNSFSATNMTFSSGINTTPPASTEDVQNFLQAQNPNVITLPSKMNADVGEDDVPF